MAKKSFDYFEKFTEQMSLSKKAARQLMDMLEHYTDVHTHAEEVHATEHEADVLLHEIMQELNRSFITPIDREDIVSLANKLDDITDAIEDVASLFDMQIITAVRPEALDFAKLIYTGCNRLHEAIEEFSRFKNSKHISALIINVNQAEEAGDRMHSSLIKKLYRDEKDAITLMKWKAIYDMMENVLDDCEEAADLLDGLIIKNS